MTKVPSASVTHSDEELQRLLRRLGSRIGTVRPWMAASESQGSVELSSVGISAQLSACLAQAGIPIFAVSTFDADDVLVIQPDAERAPTALQRARHDVSS